MPLEQPDINLVYRKSSTPTTNGATAFKGSPLTNDELDNNFYGINVEMKTKAPINNAVFTGSTAIPNIIASGGTINGTVIGGTAPVAGTFTTLNTTGNLTVGDETGDILSVRAGTALLPALTTAGDLNTGMWFPAADTIAWSTNGSERLRLADAGATIANNLTVAGDVAVNGADLTTSATTFNLLDTTATTLNLARAATAITLGATTGTTTVRNNISVTGNVAVNTDKFTITAATGNTTILGTLGVTGNVAVNTNKFTVEALSGNTVVVGTLNVTGGSTISTLIATTGTFSGQVTSTVSTGSAPFVVASTTKVTNLNADLVDGFTTDQANTASTVVVRDSSKNINISNAVMSGATSGTTTLQPAAISATSVLTLPAANDTLVGKATTDIFTNKSVSLTTNTLTGTLAQFNTALTDADFVSIAGSETLTNKTLTSPVINTATISGGTINSAPIGGTTRAAGAFTTLNANSTLDVTGATTLNSTLQVEAATTLKHNVTIAGSATPATRFFRITDGAGSPVTRFLVDSANGNTAISGDVAVNTNKFTVTAATGNTNILGTLGVTGITTLGELNAQAVTVSSLESSNAVQGTIFTSTAAIGTAPLTVTSTTKVTNLNADRVDNISFDVPTFAGGISYVTSVSSNNYEVGFIEAGVSGNILASTGGSAPQWITPTGLSAGSSRSSGHIDSGNNGDLLYQKTVTVSITTTLDSATAAVPSVATSGIEVGQILIGNPNFPAVTLGTGALPYVVSINTVANTITLSLEATASATTLTKFLSTSKLSLGTSGQVLTAGASAPAWSNSISVTGALTHGGLSPSAGTGIDQVYTVTDNLTLNTTDWFNTSVNSTELVTGSYMVQINTGNEYYTGIMSWYSPDINSLLTDEVILHRASAGTESNNLFLRVERTDTTSSDMTLQISSSAARSAANYTFKFRRML